MVWIRSWRTENIREVNNQLGIWNMKIRLSWARKSSFRGILHRDVAQGTELSLNERFQIERPALARPQSGCQVRVSKSSRANSRFPSDIESEYSSLVSIEGCAYTVNKNDNLSRYNNGIAVRTTKKVCGLMW